MNPNTLYMDSADIVYLLAGYLKVILVLMEQKDVVGNGKGSSDPRVIAIALNGGAKSKYIVRWIVEKFIPEGKVAFKLLHVFPKITGVPTPSKFYSSSMDFGNYLTRWEFFM